MRRRRSRRGLTMLELLIALSLAGVVLLGGALLLDQLTDSGARILARSVLDARSNNGDRALRRLFADAQAAADSSERFSGDARTATYVTLCDVPSGWRERCRVTLMIDSLADSSVIVAATDRGDELSLRRIAGVAAFRYFDVADHDSSWLARWAPSIAPPVAMAIVAGADTTLLPLGSARE